MSPDANRPRIGLLEVLSTCACVLICRPPNVKVMPPVTAYAQYGGLSMVSAEHGPTGLGVRIGMAGFAFVEKALAKRIDGDAIGVTVPIRFVADFDIGKSRIDGRRMRALPVARCLRAQVDRHHEHFPRVML